MMQVVRTIFLIDVLDQNETNGVRWGFHRLPDCLDLVFSREHHGDQNAGKGGSGAQGDDGQFGGKNFRREDQSPFRFILGLLLKVRITSYNVCYTKLLRETFGVW